MTARERIRDSVVHDRQHDNRLRANMHERTANEAMTTGDHREVADTARERLTETRQHDDLRLDALHERAIEALGLTDREDAAS